MTKINSNKSSARQRFKAVTGSVIIFTALTILGALAFLTVRSDVTRYAEMAEKSAVGLVVNHLELSDFTYKKLAIAAVRVLKNQTLALGPPQVRENIQVDGKVVSALQFGEVPAAGNFKMVDQVAGLMGCTATIFARRHTFRSNRRSYCRRAAGTCVLRACENSGRTLFHRL